jgi:hypothetical protein
VIEGGTEETEGEAVFGIVRDFAAVPGITVATRLAVLAAVPRVEVFGGIWREVALFAGTRRLAVFPGTGRGLAVFGTGVFAAEGSA